MMRQDPAFPVVYTATIVGSYRTTILLQFTNSMG